MSGYDRDEYDRKAAAEVRAMFLDGVVATWARRACAALPRNAKAWDRHGGVWLCVFTPPLQWEDRRGWFAVLEPFIERDLIVRGVGFELETEADLAGWAWTRMLHEHAGLLALERDPGVLMPVYARAEWFPGRPSVHEIAGFGRRA